MISKIIVGRNHYYSIPDDNNMCNENNDTHMKKTKNKNPKEGDEDDSFLLYCIIISLSDEIQLLKYYSLIMLL